MSENYVHWRENMDMPYLRAENLVPNEVRVLTIKEVRKELMPKIPGRAEEEHQNVVYFEEAGILPMVLNVTNCETIEAVYGTGNVIEWAGKKIAIYASKTSMGKKTVPCLRVKKFRPDVCIFCGKELEPAIYNGSIKKYGKPYCSGECKDKDIKGVNVI